MTTTIAIDLAKTVFGLAAADGSGRIIERRRSSRRQLEQYLSNRSADKIVMEACGMAYFCCWAQLAAAERRAKVPAFW